MLCLPGLALDYDIFLFSRVYELRSIKRSDGTAVYSTDVAIVKAVTISGSVFHAKQLLQQLGSCNVLVLLFHRPVIACAGFIMALAFVGLLVSSEKLLNEFAFIVIMGVLTDTLIIRPILLPTLLHHGDWLNWWPKQMPPVRM